MAKQSNTEEAKVEKPEKPKPHPNLPVVESKDSKVKETSNPPGDEDFNKGLYVCKEDGETYALATHEPDDYFRTHSLKNSAHFRQHTEAEFRLGFDKA